jgi:hypothetical protein
MLPKLILNSQEFLLPLNAGLKVCTVMPSLRFLSIVLNLVILFNFWVFCLFGWLVGFWVLEVFLFFVFCCLALFCF